MRSRAHRRSVCFAVSAAVILAALRTGSPSLPAPFGPDASGPAAPGEWMLLQRTGGAPPSRAQLVRASEHRRAAAARTEIASPAIAAAGWTLVGPRNVGGRVVDIAVDPIRLNTVYVATASGGMWRSVDAGLSFQSIWPADLAQAMGAVAIAPDGALYAGTGEANPGGGSLTYGGTGVFRSTDGGESWQHLGLEGTFAIGRIALDPTDPQRVFVAAAGHLFRPGGARGLYRSSDGGATWQLALPGENDTTGAVDVAIDPRDPRRVFAAMWDHLREPDDRRYGGPGSGVWRSIDGGGTWTRLGGGLPPRSPGVGRIGIAVAALLPQLVYAIVSRTDGPFEGFYASSDGGDTWTRAPVATALSMSQSTYGMWFGRVWVDPVAPTHVYAAGIQMAESLDAGRTWAVEPSTLAAVHADQHAMAWDPIVRGRVYLGNDGGVYRSHLGAEGGLDWIPSTDQPWTQFYSVDVGEQDPTRVVGGTQDNGSVRSYREVQADPSGGWNQYYGGDGEKTLINPRDQRIVYACAQYGACASSTDGGDTMQRIGGNVSWRRGWFTPLEFDPSDPRVMYFGGNLVERSDDAGRTWFPVSPELAADPGRDYPQYPFGTVTTIAAAKSDARVLFAGTDEGSVWTTTDGGENWTRMSDPDLPGRWVTRVAVDARTASTAYAAFSGYRSGDDRAHVARTTDGGSSWRDVSGDLPDAPVNDVVPVGEGLFAATDVGVFFTPDAAALAPEWLLVGADLPLAPVTDLRWHEPTGSLFAATFGRGIYRARPPV